MLSKKMLLIFCWIYALTQITSMFCMEEEGALTTGAATSVEAIPQQPELIQEWSKFFKTDEKFEKSFIFDTEDFEKMIALQTNKSTYFFVFGDNELSQVQTVSGKFFDNVEHYIPTVYQAEESYIFYVAKKKPSIFFKDKYVVEKMSFRKDKDKIEYYPSLFEHNTPIMHLDMLGQGAKKCIVAGSFYPSIKIYDLKKGKVTRTLHNRFLLGANDTTLIFAKKIDPRPYFGLGRKLAYDLNKQYNCKVFSLRLVHNNNEEISYSENFVIDFKAYPFLIRWTTLIFDPKENTIVDYENEKKLFNLSQLAEYINKGDKIEFADNATDNDTLNKIVELFTEKSFLTLFKKCITYESFMTFGRSNKSNNSLSDYFNSIINPLVQKIIEPNSSLCKNITQIISNRFLEKINILLPGGSASITFTKQSFNLLKQTISDNRFELGSAWWTKIKTDLIQNTLMYQPEYIPQKQVKNVYIHNNHLIIQAKNDISQGTLTNNLTIFEKCYTAEDEIDNSYVVDDTLFIIVKNGLYRLVLPTQSNILQEPLKELYPAEKIEGIEKIITELKKENVINDLKILFNSVITFPINSLNDIPNFKGVRGETGITPCLQEGYLRPILHSWISSIAQSYEHSFDTDNDEFNKVLYALEKEMNDINIWIAGGLQVKDVYTKISQPYIPSQQSAEDSKKQEAIYTEKVLERFKKLNLQFGQKSDTYDEYMRSLSLCYGMETVEFEIGGQNQTYLAYARNHFINRVNEIKDLKLDSLSILHRATQTEN